MPNIQTYNVIPNLPAAARTAARDGLQSLVDVGTIGPPALPASRSRAVGSDESQSGAHAPALAPGAAGRGGEGRSFPARPRGGLWGLQEISRAARTPTGRKAPGREIKKPIAYFSAEFGFHESIPNYSGGLGILSGDHCKSASDLDLNFVAVGLLYRHGYFKQQINKEGWQEAINLNQNFHHLPIREVMRNDQILLVSVPLLGREVFAKIWELHVGPDQSLSARHRYCGEPSGRSIDYGRVIRRRSRDADAPGDRSRDRRRKGTERSRL